MFNISSLILMTIRNMMTINLSKKKESSLPPEIMIRNSRFKINQISILKFMYLLKIKLFIFDQNQSHSFKSIIKMSNMMEKKKKKKI